jgi:hypothetical protein
MYYPYRDEYEYYPIVRSVGLEKKIWTKLFFCPDFKKPRVAICCEVNMNVEAVKTHFPLWIEDLVYSEREKLCSKAKQPLLLPDRRGYPNLFLFMKSYNLTPISYKCVCHLWRRSCPNRHSCYYKDGPPRYDHGSLWGFKDNFNGPKKLVCFVYQPYGFDEKDEQDLKAWCEEKGLISVVKPPSESFWFPGSTSLVQVWNRHAYQKAIDFENNLFRGNNDQTGILSETS